MKNHVLEEIMGAVEENLNETELDNADYLLKRICYIGENGLE